ncbi:MAG: hypothetical protein SVN78_04855 [Deferribacterota bacterium]|nr:hypothetical protein [Deferribacterota bacterium]
MNNIVVYNQRLNDKYNILGFHSSNLSKKAKPGNFLMLNTNINKNITDPLLRRAFAICNIKDDIVYILYKVIGKGTKNLTYYKNGDVIVSSDILGNSFNLGYTNKKIALIAGGIGIAPLLFLIKYIDKSNVIDLYYGGKSSNDICLVDIIISFNSFNTLNSSTKHISLLDFPP